MSDQRRDALVRAMAEGAYGLPLLPREEKQMGLALDALLVVLMPHTEALRWIVSDWISEGFTVPPYTDEQYDIFEALGLDPAKFQYDIRRVVEE